MHAFWTTADLRRAGKSEREIRRAVQQGALQVVRRGHLVLPGTDESLIRAVRVGEIATATTAAQARGLWTPPDAGPDPTGGVHRALLHVAVPRNAPRLRHPDDPTRPLLHDGSVALHWTDPLDVGATRRTGAASPLLMLQQAFLSQPPERAVAIADSALKQRWLRVADLPALAARLPSHLAAAALSATPDSDSGLESIARFLLRALGLRVEVLVGVPGVGVVDLLVEGRLIVELDGREFHEGDRFERDRGRDLRAALARYRVLRFTWRQVLFEWPAVEAAVLAVLAQS